MKIFFFQLAFVVGLVQLFTPLNAQQQANTNQNNQLVVLSNAAITVPQLLEFDESPNAMVPYRIVQSYAVREKYAGKNSTLISSKSKLNKEFTRVLTYGEDPALSEINFSNNAVIAISEKGLPVGTVLAPVSLSEEGKNLVLVYEVRKPSYSERTYNPLFLLVIDKKYKRHSLKISRIVR